MATARIVLLFLFSLFPHHHRPDPDVLAFISSAQQNLQSYEDGSFDSLVEQSRIIEIDNNIRLLARTPFKTSITAELMHEINIDLSELQSYDLKLQKGPAGLENPAPNSI